MDSTVGARHQWRVRGGLGAGNVRACVKRRLHCACDHGRVRVLVVEDEPTVAEPLLAGLRRHGLGVTHLGHGTGVTAAVLAAPHPDTVLLDLGLPDIDGLDVLRDLRRVSDIPVIILSARGEESDRIVGLELGADDYVVKPFSVREVVARIRAISRRRHAERPITAGGLQIDRSRRTVTIDHSAIDLTVKEFDLLSVLAEEPGRVVPRQELFARIWDPVWFGTGKTLDVHISSLRRKLGPSVVIRTVRGIGYQLAPPTE